MIASIAVCHAGKLEPTDDNLRKSRNTLYKWARCHAVEFECDLIVSLQCVTESASLLGLPIIDWHYNPAGNRYPEFKWPTYKSEAQWRAVWKELTRICSQHTHSLWTWYDQQRAVAS